VEASEVTLHVSLSKTEEDERMTYIGIVLSTHEPPTLAKLRAFALDAASERESTSHSWHYSLPLSFNPLT
jgi:hypothetical protein